MQLKLINTRCEPNCAIDGISLIQTHCGPPVVFIHIIDTFTFCFCLLSWIIFYLPEVNFFMTTAHFSLFLSLAMAFVCVCVCLFSKFDWNLFNQFTCAQFICTFVCWIFYSTSIRTTECCLETMWKIQIYQKSITYWCFEKKNTRWNIVAVYIASYLMIPWRENPHRAL